PLLVTTGLRQAPCGSAQLFANPQACVGEARTVGAATQAATGLQAGGLSSSPQDRFATTTRHAAIQSFPIRTVTP
ncbi:MAG TPA: hypothetical protein VM691_09125, partial [Myxococcales bacterium]|nr:hypothetical protein [Myxococcales bacterium]